MVIEFFLGGGVLIFYPCLLSMNEVHVKKDTENLVSFLCGLHMEMVKKKENLKEVVFSS